MPDPTPVETRCVALTVPGRPQAKGRPRFVMATRHVYTPTGTGEAEEILQAEMYRVCRRPLEGPLELIVSFRFRRPQSWSKLRREAVDEGVEEPWRTGKPDLDNLVKTVKDAAKGILWHDDAQVVVLEADKAYGPDDETIINVSPVHG